MNGKRILCAVGRALLAAILGAASNGIFAQTYPEKPIRWIVANAPGSSANIVARLVGQKLGESLGKQVVVDNRPGAGGVIGTEAAAKAAPDGYTIALATSANFAYAVSLRSKLPYDPVNDFMAVTLIASSPFVLVVHPSVPAKSVKELLALAKSRPRQLSFASGGNGSVSHLSGELFKTLTGIGMVHAAYKGGSQTIPAVISGEVSLMFVGLGAALPNAQAGKLRILAITSAKRSALMPDLPTVSESGVPGYEMNPWWGVVAPAKTPKEIIARLNAETVAILKTPDIKDRFAKLGFEPAGNTPEEFAAHIRAEIAKWAKVIKDAGIHIE
jgi:tripartite-type tricarboxylate transporter receptor subunit TctC